MPLPELTTAQKYGPIFRARRVGLGLRGNEIGLPRSVWARLHRIEDGDEDPDCGWELLRQRIYAALIRRVTDHVKRGGNLAQLFDQVRGWPSYTLWAEYVTAKADLEIERELSGRGSDRAVV